MLELPFYISIAVLVMILLWNEASHRKTEKNLIDKILIQRGLEPIPDSSPMANVLEAVGAKPRDPMKIMQDELQRRKKRVVGMPQENVSFRIPGMPQVKAK